MAEINLTGSIARSNNFALDNTNVYNSLVEAQAYVNDINSLAYNGQIIAVKNGDVYDVYTINADAKTLTKIGGDGTTSSTIPDSSSGDTSGGTTNTGDTSGDSTDTGSGEASGGETTEGETEGGDTSTDTTEDTSTEGEASGDTTDETSTDTTDTSTSDKYYILAIAGQSNAVGYDESANDGDYYVSNDRIKQINCRSLTDNTISTLGRTALSSQNLDAQGVNQNGTKGMHLPLATSILPHIPDDYGILVVPVAYGSTGFVNTTLTDSTEIQTIGGTGKNGKWSADDTSALYTQLKSKISTAMSLNEENKFLGMVWLQGEADNANAASHKSGFEAMMTNFFEYMETNHSGKSVSGVYDKTIVYIPQSTYYWSTQGQYATILSNYQTWSPTTYIPITSTSEHTNETNGVTPANGQNGSTSSTPASHYGNNAYATLVAPAIYTKMVENGLLPALEGQDTSGDTTEDTSTEGEATEGDTSSDTGNTDTGDTSGETTQEGWIPTIDDLLWRSLGTNNYLYVNEEGKVYTSLAMFNTQAQTKWGVAYPSIAFREATKITFTASRGVYWLLAQYNGDNTNAKYKYYCLDGGNTMKTTGIVTYDSSGVGTFEQGTALSEPIPVTFGDEVTIEVTSTGFSVTNATQNYTKSVTIAEESPYIPCIGFMFNINDAEMDTTHEWAERIVLLDNVRVITPETSSYQTASTEGETTNETTETTQATNA